PCDQFPGRWFEMMESKAVPSKRSAIRSDVLQQVLAFASLIVMFVVFSLASPNFATFTNIVGILLSTAVIGILAVGVTFVIITGGIRTRSGRCSTSRRWMPAGVLRQEQAVVAELGPPHPGKLVEQILHRHLLSLRAG